MKIASIDIGSNTVLMLIADYNTKTKELKFLKNYYRMPRLAKNLDSDGNIKEENIMAFYKVLEEYNEIIKAEHCDVVLPYATAAMRNAKNSSIILAEVKKRFNLDIKIIEGTKEAEFSFLGATSGNLTKENICVVDIGGASTEIIIGNVEGLNFVKSFNLGTVKLTDKFFFNDPPNAFEINNLKDFLKEIFSELNKLNVEKIVAVAGTPTTLSSMLKGFKEYYEDEIENSVITSDILDSLISEMEKLTSKEILENYGKIVEGRNDVILAGAFILKSIMENLRRESVIVSGHGLRYGIIYSYINSLN